MSTTLSTKGTTLTLPQPQHKLSEVIVNEVDRILPALTGGVDAQEFAAACVVAANELKEGSCSPNSVLLSAYHAARIGLMPGSLLGLCYFIPRKKRCNLEIGYQGYLDLAFRNQHLKTVYADVILRDEIDQGMFEYGVENGRPFLNHRPELERDTDPNTLRSKVVGAYCIYYERTSDVPAFRVLNRKDLDRVDSKEHVWASNYFEMCRKTAIRRAAKNWRKTNDLRLALTLEDQSEIGQAQSLGQALLPTDTDSFSLEEVEVDAE